MFVCLVWSFVCCMCICKGRLCRRCVCVGVRACVCERACVCTCACVGRCTYAYTCTCTRACACIKNMLYNIYIYMRTHTVYTCTYICTHINMEGTSAKAYDNAHTHLHVKHKYTYTHIIYLMYISALSSIMWQYTSLCAAMFDMI